MRAATALRLCGGGGGWVTWSPAYLLNTPCTGTAQQDGALVETVSAYCYTARQSSAIAVAPTEYVVTTTWPTFVDKPLLLVVVDESSSGSSP